MNTNEFIMNDLNDDFINGRRIPTVYAEPTPSGNGLRFYCIYCGVWHQHGRGDGHAVAHCFVEDSPYSETGYELVEVEKAPVPEKRYKAKYLRDGRLVSGYLYAQQRARRR
jgi:hypothetical protein